MITLLSQSRDGRYHFRVLPSSNPNSHNFARAERSELLLPTDHSLCPPQCLVHAEHEILIFLCFEVFGSESRYYQFHNCPVVGFQVEDVRAAKQEMESKGIQFMTDVFGDDKEAWAYFRGPDGYLYEIWQTQRPLKAPLLSA